MYWIDVTKPKPPPQERTMPTHLMVLLLPLMLAQKPPPPASVRHSTLELAPMWFERAGLRFVTRAYNNSIPGPAIIGG